MSTSFLSDALNIAYSIIMPQLHSNTDNTLAILRFEIASLLFQMTDLILQRF